MNKPRRLFKFLIGMVLLFLWLGLMFYQSFQIENVFTVLTKEYPRKSVSVLPDGELYQGDKIVGEFEATENYLGIIGFRFWTYYRLNDDYLIFRIREKKSLDWYYQNRYKADQFQPNQYFTFGFPAITGSVGKRYVFEIESSQGRPGIAVGASEIDPIFVAKYKYPRELVTSSTQKFISFSTNKLIDLIYRTEFRVSSFIYLIPFLLYLLSFTSTYMSFERRFKSFAQERLKFVWQLITESNIDSDNSVDIVIKRVFLFMSTRYKDTQTILEKLKLLIDIITTPIVLSVILLVRFSFRHPDILSICIMMIGSVLDSLFIKSGDTTIPVLTILWIYLIYKYQLVDKLFFVTAFGFLVGSAVLYYSNWFIASERAGAWAWIFLTITVIMNIIKLKD